METNEQIINEAESSAQNVAQEATPQPAKKTRTPRKKKETSDLASEKKSRTPRKKKTDEPAQPAETTEQQVTDSVTEPKQEQVSTEQPKQEQKPEPKHQQPKQEEQKQQPKQEQPKPEQPKQEQKPAQPKPLPPCPTLLIRNIVELMNAPQRQLLLNDQQIQQLTIEDAEKRFRWIEGTLALVLNYDVVLSDTNIWLELLTGHTSSHSDPRYNCRLQFERQIEFISKLVSYRRGRFMIMSETYEEIDRFATAMDPQSHKDADFSDEDVCRNIAGRLAKRLILSMQRENRLRIEGIGSESHHASFADPAIIRRCVELFAKGKKVLLLTNDASVAIRSMGMCDDLQRTNNIEDEVWDEQYAPLRPMAMTFDDLKTLDAYTRQYHFLQMAAGKQWMEDVPQGMEKHSVEHLALWEEGFRPGDRHSEKKLQQQKQKQEQQRQEQMKQQQKQEQQKLDQLKQQQKQEQQRLDQLKQQQKQEQQRQEQLKQEQLRQQQKQQEILRMQQEQIKLQQDQLKQQQHEVREAMEANEAPAPKPAEQSPVLEAQAEQPQQPQPLEQTAVQSAVQPQQVAEAQPTEQLQQGEQPQTTEQDAKNDEPKKKRPSRRGGRRPSQKSGAKKPKPQNAENA